MHVAEIHADLVQRQKDYPNEHPVQNPLRVFKRGGKFIVYAGGYRYLASLRALLTMMPCIVLPRELDEAEMLVEQSKDNALHLPYTPMEDAHNVLQLLKLRPGLTQAKAGQLLGLLPAKTTKLLKILGHYPQDLHGLIGEKEGCVPINAAYPLARLMAKRHDEAKVRELTDRVVKGQLSCEDAIKTVDRILKPKSESGRKNRAVKLSYGGVTAQVRTNVIEELKAFHSKLGEALKRMDRDNLPAEFIEALMK
jgi:ParB-like chromosome segregation protein Spo0J